MKLFASAQAQPRSLKLLGWVTLPVLALAMFVQATGVGIDLLVIGVAALVLFALERSLGDWLGEWIGPLAAAGVFVVFALALAWYFLSASLGRSQTDSFFIEAEHRGYKTVYYRTPRASADAPAAASAGSTASAPVATGGSASRAPAAAGSPDVAPAAGPAGDDGTGGAVASAGGGSDRRRESSVLSFFRRRSDPEQRIATEISVSVEPARVAAARQTIIRATVRAADGSAVSGNVEFTVNNLGAGRVALDASGVASTTYRTHILGSYEVRARFAGTSRYASSRAGPVILTVFGPR